MMQTTALWYAVYTKPKWEKKVAGLLQKRGITAYCPLNKVVKQWHDRKKTIEEPLFTSYVFVQVTPSEQLEVRKTDGVFNFVHWLGKPAVIKPEEIATIKNFLLQYQTVVLEKVDIRPNDNVQILQGPLMSREGRVVEVHQKAVKVAIPSLGYALIAQVNISKVELLKNADSYTQTMRSTSVDQMLTA